MVAVFVRYKRTGNCSLAKVPVVFVMFEILVYRAELRLPQVAPKLVDLTCLLAKIQENAPLLG